MRKKTLRVLHLFEFVLVFILLSVYLLSNQKTLIYLADKVTQNYDIRYKNISGNILTKIKIKDISYHDKTIAKEARIDFNLLKLLLLKLDVEGLEFKKVDMKNLRYLINDRFSTNTKTDNSSKQLPINIDIHNISLDVLPYKKDELEIASLKIFLDRLQLSNNLNINSLKVAMQSNYFNLNYKGSYKDKNLHINKLNISKLEIKKLLFLKDLMKKDSSSKDTLVKSLVVDRAKLSIQPYSKKHYKISSLDADVFDFKLKDSNITARALNLKVDTNIWKLTSTGYVKDSTFFSKVKVNLNNKYFQKFIPNLNFNSLNPVDVKLKIDKNSLIGDVSSSSDKLFDGFFGKLKLKAKELKAHVVFDFKTLCVDFTAFSKLSSKYVDSFKVDGEFHFKPKKNITYKANVHFDNFKELDSRLLALLKDTKLTLKGDLKGLEAQASSTLLEANYDSKQSFIKPLIQLHSKEFTLDTLDKNLTNKIKTSFTLSTKLNYKDIKNTKLNYTINSNTLDAKGSYLVKNSTLEALLELPQNTILKSKNLNLQNLFPLKVKAQIKKQNTDIEAFSKKLKLDARYNYKDASYSATLNAPDTVIKVTKKDTLEYSLESESIKESLDILNSIYKLPDMNIDAQVSLKGSYKQNKNSFTINSKWFLDEYSRYKYLFLENTKLNCEFSDQKLIIKNYKSDAYIFEKYRKLFSTRESVISFLDDKVTLEFNINNDMLIKADINEKLKLNIYSKDFHIQEPEADIHTLVNINYFKNKNYSSLTGKIGLLSGVVKYKPRKSYDINDKDIVFLNKKKGKKASKNNQKINLNIKTYNTIRYKQGATNIKLKADISLVKELKKHLNTYGVLSIVDGIYITDNKKFTLGKGKILFAGELLNPYLELKAYYKKDPYDITVNIGGKLDSPNLNFSSSPYLSQNDILSILLFNSKASSLTNSTSSSNPALSLFGSTFARGILKTLGVKLDRVEITSTQDGSVGVELEKRVGRRTTIIYQNDLVQTVKLRYENTKNIETDLTFSPDSSSIDIIFKNEK